MSKFASPAKTATMARPVTGSIGRKATHEGYDGHELNPKSALYTLAVTSLIEPKFYESAKSGLDRLRSLTKQVTESDPEWVANFVPWLRGTGNMRSASVAVAAEYAKAGGPNARRVIASAIQRADEPAEMLGYWFSHYGKTLPAAVKRGIADGARAQYSEWTALKYDGKGRDIRFADVIDLTHPKPKDDIQSAVFKWCLDRRHNRSDIDLSGLESARLDRELQTLPIETRGDRIADAIDAGWSWERLAGWLPGGMDARAWEHVIPNMGYMARLRNLRNFEEAKVNPKALSSVADYLADPEQVAKSRQFPYRFWSAHKHANSITFGPALERALDLSVQNIPALPGRTLVMVDTSASMSPGFHSYGRGSAPISPVEIAGLFGASVWFRNPGQVDISIYADSAIPLKTSGVSLLRNMEALVREIGVVGHGTRTWPSTASQYDGHDRIIVFTDMQDHPARVSSLPDVPVYVFDLAGYGVANVEPRPGRYLFGGFTDAHFRLLPLIEAGEAEIWPWETTNA
jgi:hypothetical protein